MAHTYAGILGPLAFLTCLARGTLHGGGAESVLLGAWCGLLAFSVVGYFVGRIGEWVVGESVSGRLAAEVAAEQATAASPARAANAAPA